MGSNSTFDGMIRILQMQDERELNRKVIKMATIAEQADMVTKTAMQLRKDDPSLSYKEAGEAAREMLGLNDLI